jgi:hypothetical protein
VPTEKAVKTYIGSVVLDTTGIGVRIASIIDDTSKYINRYDTAAWAAQILQRVTADDTAGIGTRIASIIDDTFKYVNRYDTATWATGLLYRSKAQHDTAGIGARISANDDDIVGLQTTTGNLNDTILVMVRATDDTLTSTEVKSGYIFAINRNLNGFNLAQVEAFSPGNGNGTAAVKVYRLRGGTLQTVTSTGADISGTATVDTDYDDVITGDYYDFGYKETGATSYTIAVDVYLKFVRP